MNIFKQINLNVDKSLFAIVLSIILVSCSKDARFEQIQCRFNDKNNEILVIQFSNKIAKRTVSLNPSQNTMTFKGTTLEDLKWAANIDEVKIFEIDKNNLFSATFKADGKKFQFGKITSDCSLLIKNNLGKLYVSSQ